MLVLTVTQKKPELTDIASQFFIVHNQTRDELLARLCGLCSSSASISAYATGLGLALSATTSDGHVAIVEQILPNGDIQLSEMNASVAGGGYNIVSGRIVPAANVHQYVYIH